MFGSSLPIQAFPRKIRASLNRHSENQQLNEQIIITEDDYLNAGADEMQRIFLRLSKASQRYFPRYQKPSQLTLTYRTA